MRSWCKSIRRDVKNIFLPRPEWRWFFDFQPLVLWKGLGFAFCLRAVHQVLPRSISVASSLIVTTAVVFSPVIQILTVHYHPFPTCNTAHQNGIMPRPERQTPLTQRFTDEIDKNYPAGDRPVRDGRHLFDHRMETFYRPQSPSANRAQVRGKPDAQGPRPISGGKPR